MKYVIFLLALALNSSLLSGQTCVPEYYATYDFTVVTDTSAESFRRPQEFVLLKHDGRSFFKSSNQRFNDSMTLAYTNEHPEIENYRTPQELQAAVDAFTANMQGWRKPNGVDYRVTKDLKNATFSNQLTFAFPPQHLEAPLLSGWTLQPAQDTISGMNCQSATIHYGGRNYTAWYTPQIPISDGPYVFSGLPGLIVKIEDEKGWYKFQLKTFSAKNTERFFKPNFINPHSQAISREAFVSQSNNQKENPRIYGVEGMDSEQLLEMKQSYKWRYYLVLEQND